MLWMLLAALAGAAMNAFIRDLSTFMHAFEIAFFRNLFGLLALAPLMWRTGAAVFRTGQLRLHALRGLLNTAAMLSFFFAVGITPLATVAALSFTSPLFATLLASLILGETLSRARLLGLIIGLAGALVIIRPGLVTVGFGELLVVASSAFWAAALIDIKILSRTESSLTITVYAALFLTPITLLFALPVWTWPDLAHFPPLLAIGALGSVGQLALVQAFRQADATQVLPGDFTKLIWASAIGYFAFAEIPDGWVFVGGAAIFFGAAHVAYAESTRRR